MNLPQWLETKAVSPSYGGCVVLGVALCFFGAAVNTMAGWLYVISGTIAALLIICAILSRRTLQGINLRRLSIEPVTNGTPIFVEIILENTTKKAKTLIQVQEVLPYTLATEPLTTAIEVIPPFKSHKCNFYVDSKKRGVYHWHEVRLRTGTPLGLWWHTRIMEIPAMAVVYPRIIPLNHCPLIDSMGIEDSNNYQSNSRYQSANEGVTKTLRQYRTGDPTRLIHWRTSARFGELQVRELETITGGQEIIICIDTLATWQEDIFEMAVEVAASLYFYASRCQLKVSLWSTATGLVSGNRVVLQELAAINPQQEQHHNLPHSPIIWLTSNLVSLSSLPLYSRWLLFPGSQNTPSIVSHNLSGLVINPEEFLPPQLQKPLI